MINCLQLFRKINNLMGYYKRNLSYKINLKGVLQNMRVRSIDSKNKNKIIYLQFNNYANKSKNSKRNSLNQVKLKKNVLKLKFKIYNLQILRLNKNRMNE